MLNAVDLPLQDLANVVEMDRGRRVFSLHHLTQALLQSLAFLDVRQHAAFEQLIFELQRLQLHWVLDQHSEERFWVVMLLLEELEE